MEESHQPDEKPKFLDNEMRPGIARLLAVAQVGLGIMMLVVGPIIFCAEGIATEERVGAILGGLGFGGLFVWMGVRNWRLANEAERGKDGDSGGSH